VTEAKPDNETLNRVVDEQLDLMLQQIFPDATPEERAQLKAESAPLIDKGEPPTEAQLQVLAAVMNGIAIRLRLKPELVAFRTTRWFEYLGYALSAKTMLVDFFDEDQLREILQGGIKAPEHLSSEERIMVHVAQFMRAGLEPLLPQAEPEQLEAVAAMCLDLWGDEGLGEMATQQLNSFLVQQQLTVAEQDRGELIQKINALVDAADKEHALFTVQVAREDLDTFEAALLEPNADGKQLVRYEMRILLEERRELLQNLSPDMQERFDANTERLNVLREQLLSKVPPATH
jgi:hypothetical protein